MSAMTLILLFCGSIVLIFLVFLIIKEVRKFDSELELRNIEGEQYFRFNQDLENEY